MITDEALLEERQGLAAVVASDGSWFGRE